MGCTRATQTRPDCSTGANRDFLPVGDPGGGALVIEADIAVACRERENVFDAELTGLLDRDIHDRLWKR